MTREEMEILADIVVNKLLEKQKEYDEQFKKEIEELQNDFKDYGNIIIQTDQEALDESRKALDDVKVLSMDYLNNLINEAVQAEDYEKAKVLNDILKNMRE